MQLWDFEICPSRRLWCSLSEGFSGLTVPKIIQERYCKDNFGVFKLVNILKNNKFIYSWKHLNIKPNKTHFSKKVSPFITTLHVVKGAFPELRYIFIVYVSESEHVTDKRVISRSLEARERTAVSFPWYSG